MFIQLLDYLLMKLLRIVRRGDFDAFEIMSMKVNEFYEKLVLMGKREDAGNSCVKGN